MKHIKSLTIISLPIVIAIVIGTCAFSGGAAEQPSSGCGHSSGGCGSSCGAPAPAKDAATQLNLTSAQKQKIANIERERDAKLKRIYARLDAKDAAVRKLTADPKASRDSIKKAVYEMSNAQADISLTSIFAKRAKEALYTPAQKAAVAKAAGSCGCGCGSK